MFKFIRSGDILIRSSDILTILVGAWRMFFKQKLFHNRCDVPEDFCEFCWFGQYVSSSIYAVATVTSSDLSAINGHMECFF